MKYAFKGCVGKKRSITEEERGPLWKRGGEEVNLIADVFTHKTLRWTHLLVPGMVQRR